MRKPISPWQAYFIAILPSLGLIVIMLSLRRVIGNGALGILPLAYIWLGFWLGWRLTLGSCPRWLQALRLAAWCWSAAAIFHLTYLFAGNLLAKSDPGLFQWRLDQPFQRLIESTPKLGTIFMLVWLVFQGIRKTLHQFWSRSKRRLQTTLTLRFILTVIFTLALVLFLPALIFAAGISIAIPVEAEAGLYAQQVAASLETMPAGQRGQTVDILFDWLSDGSVLPTSPKTTYSILVYVYRLPAQFIFRRLCGLAWLDPEGNVISANGILASHSSPEWSAEDEAAWISIFGSAVQGDRDILNNSRRVYSVDGVPRLYGAAPVEDSSGRVEGVIIACVQMSFPLGAPANRATPLVVFSLIVLTFGLAALCVFPPAAMVSFVIGHRMARNITLPLRELSIAAKAMTDGDLAHRAPLDRSDELGDLAHQFNLMAGQLQSTLDALQNESDRVAELAHAQQELVANVSHDLRTPLASLKAHIESLESHPELLSKYLPILQDETTRLARMVEDLFALARLEARELDVNLTYIELPSLIKKTLASFSDQAWNDHRLVFEVDVPEELPEVRADPQRLEQVLTNLLTNALRYTPEGGIITVSSREVGAEWVEVRVTDTGIGISTEDLPHVFDRFYQADRARTRSGAGLGLTIAKSLIEIMGGKIGAESALGEGSSFWFTLPVSNRQGEN